MSDDKVIKMVNRDMKDNASVVQELERAVRFAKQDGCIAVVIGLLSPDMAVTMLRHANDIDALLLSASAQANAAARFVEGQAHPAEPIDPDGEPA